MRIGIKKKKISISLDLDVHEKLKKICNKDDAKVSTRINRILRKDLRLS